METVRFIAIALLAATLAACQSKIPALGSHPVEGRWVVDEDATLTELEPLFEHVFTTIFDEKTRAKLGEAAEALAESFVRNLPPEEGMDPHDQLAGIRAEVARSLESPMSGEVEFESDLRYVDFQSGGNVLWINKDGQTSKGRWKLADNGVHILNTDDGVKMTGSILGDRLHVLTPTGYPAFPTVKTIFMRE